MKTYCKRKDISNIDFVKNCITPFLHERLDKSNVAKLFAYYNGISNTKSRKNIDTFPEYVSDTIDKIAESISENLKSRTVTADGKKVVLTYKEFELFKCLLENRGIVLSRDVLMNRIWDTEFEGETRTVDVHVRTLRQKIGACGEYIQTVRNVGYKVE